MSNPSNPVNPAAAAPTQAAPTPADPVLTGRPTLPSARKGTMTAAPAPAKPAEPTAAAANAKAEAAAEVRRLKLKIDGQDVDLPMEEIVRMAQQAGSANKRWESASKMRRDTEQVLALLAKNPHAALETILGSPAAVRAFYEDRLMEQVRADSMSPAEKAQAAQAEKLRAYEAKEAQEKEAAKQRAEQAKSEHYEREYTQKFTSALEKSGVPADAKSFARMAQLQRIAIKRGYDVTADQLAKLVREDFQAEQRHILSKLPGDQLLEWLGSDVVGKMSKAQVKKLRASGLPPSARAATSATMAQRRGETPAVQGKGDWSAFRRRNRGYSG